MEKIHLERIAYVITKNFHTLWSLNKRKITLHEKTTQEKTGKQEIPVETKIVVA